MAALVPRGSNAPPDVNAPGDLPWFAKLGLLGGFFRRKNLGRKLLLATPEANLVTLLETIGEDSLASGSTIACSLERQDQSAPTDRPACVGFLRWGTDGYQHAAEFDFDDGVQLCVAASYVEVTAGIDRDAPGNGTGETFHPTFVGATIGYLPPSSRTPLRTRYAAFANPPAGPVTLSVPPFARDFVVLKSVAGTAITVEQLDRTGTTIVLETSAGQIAQVLANDCRNIRITAAAGPLLVRAVFSLFL